MNERMLVVDDPTHGSLRAATLVSADPIGMCLFLFGGGGHAGMLWELAPALHAAGDVPPMVLASLEVPPWCFYLDDPTTGVAWETAVADHLVSALRVEHGASLPLGLVGVSMGGHAALRIAFSRPKTVTAVAAVAPMVEPWREDGDVPLRNRLHYPPECPGRLVGPDRDLGLWRRSHPAMHALRNASALIAQRQAIRLDAGSRDTLCAHDGAESLHRVLWGLDVPHAYHLHRDADHIGPSVLPRLVDAFRWVGCHLAGGLALSEESEALRAALAPARREALTRDPSIARTYGVLER